MEITQSEQQRDNRLKKNPTQQKNRTSETWGTLIGRPIIFVARIPEREEEDSGPPNIFEEVLDEYFLNLVNHKCTVSRNLVKPGEDNLTEIHAKTHHSQTYEN